MKRTLIIGLLTLAALWVLAAGASAQQRLVVPRGAQVLLAFDQPVNFGRVLVGQRIQLHVVNNLLVGNTVIVPNGTRVIGVIQQVGAYPRVGRPGRLRLVLLPVRTAFGSQLSLQPRGLHRIAGRPLRLRAGQQLLSVVSARTVIVARSPYPGRRYGQRPYGGYAPRRYGVMPRA